MMQRFYEIQNSFLKGALIVTNPQQFSSYQFMRGEFQIPPPMQFSRNMGHKMYDAIHGSDMGVQLFHNRFFDALRNEGVTGFDSLPALISLENKSIDDYSCLIVKGRADNIDYYKGEVIDKGPIVPGGTSIVIKKGIYFDSWDGSDIFLLEGKLYILITQKVKDIVDKLKLTNVTLIDTVDREIDIHHLSDGHPERLQFYMDQLNGKAK